MKNFEELGIGDIYQRAAGKAEGCFMDHPNTFELIANYTSPNLEEIAHFHEGNAFEIRFCVLDDVIFFLFRPEAEPWQDAPFSPHLASSKDYPDVEDGAGYALMLFLTDAPRGTIKEMRMIGLGPGFSRALQREITAILEKPFDIYGYYRSINDIYSKYSTRDLLKFTAPDCRFKVH